MFVPKIRYFCHVCQPWGRSVLYLMESKQSPLIIVYQAIATNSGKVALTLSDDDVHVSVFLSVTKINT